MAISDASRPTANVLNLLTPSSDNQREIAVGESLREKLERTDSMVNYVNTRYQSNTNVRSYDRHRDTTDVTVEDDFVGGELPAGTETASFSTDELSWGKNYLKAQAIASWQDITEGVLDPTLLLGNDLGSKLVRKLDDSIYTLIRDYDLTAVVNDYLDTTDTTPQVFKPTGTASDYLSDDAVKVGDEPLILPLIERAFVRLSRQNKGSGRVSSQTRWNVLMPIECWVQFSRELGARGVDVLTLEEISGTGRTFAWEIFDIQVNNVSVKSEVNATTGAIVASGGKKAWLLHFWTPEAVTYAIRNQVMRVLQPMEAANQSTNWKVNYIAQQLLAVDDPRWLYRASILAEA